MTLGLSIPEFAYRGFRKSSWRLSGFDLQLDGAVNALVGVNGAGKSTVFGLVAGTISANVGVEVDGVDCGTGTPGRQSKIGYLAQGNGLPNSMSARTAIEYCGWLKGVSSSESSKLVQQALEVTDTSQWASRACRKLSGGTARRVALACALVHRPALLLLDEPTTGLDPLQRAGFYQVIREGDLAPNLLLSTHLMEDVTSLATEMVVLDSGRLCSQTEVVVAAGSELSPSVLTEYLKRELA